MVWVVARRVELGEFADQDNLSLEELFAILLYCRRSWSHRYLFHHSDSACLLLRRISAVFSSVSCSPFSVMANLLWSYACQGESSMIAILSRPAFLRSILYVDA